MRKMDITLLFGSMVSTWAHNVVVPMGNPHDGGNIVMTGDPLPHEEWD